MRLLTITIMAATGSCLCGATLGQGVVVLPPLHLNAPLGDSGPEPSLPTILHRLGYAIDVTRDEIDSQLFDPAGRGAVVSIPISAFGLMSRCDTGWYVPNDPDPPKKILLWSVDGPFNKRDAPPIMKGGATRFRPKGTFGVWVSTTGFKNETVYSEDGLQRLHPRFKPDDWHKARVFPAKTASGTIKNTYIICWEYSTNNDFQDIVTRLENARPHPNTMPVIRLLKKKRLAVLATRP